MPVDARHLVGDLRQHPCVLCQLPRFRVKVRKDDRRGQKQQKVEGREGYIKAGFRHVDLPIIRLNFRGPEVRHQELQLVGFARLHSNSPAAACISPQRKQRGIGLSRNCFDSSIFRFVNAFASNHMHMHVLPQNSMKLEALQRSEPENLGHSKALEPNVLRFIPLLSRNSTRFNTFLLDRIRYSSPACRNGHKD